LSSFKRNCIPSNSVGGLCWIVFPLILLGEPKAIWLKREFEKKEVMEVAKAMNGDKELNHDGFFVPFLQTC
jgi:hypothetical protein